MTLRVRLAMVNAQRPPQPPIPFAISSSKQAVIQEASQPELDVGCEPFSLGSGVGVLRPASRAGT